MPLERFQKWKPASAALVIWSTKFYILEGEIFKVESEIINKWNSPQIVCLKCQLLWYCAMTLIEAVFKKTRGYHGFKSMIK